MQRGFGTMGWRFNRVNVLFGLLALVGILQFAGAIWWTIANYPGGYSLTGNFISDLGRRVTRGGTDNGTCAMLFSASMVALAIALLPFFTVMPGVFHSGRVVLRISGVLCAAGLAGIGLTPYDQFFIAHHVALAVWIIAMVAMVVTFFVCAQSSGAASKGVWIGTGLVLFAIFGYAFAGEFTAHVVFQKVLVVLAVAWLCTVLVTVSVSTVRAATSYSMLADKQARQYLERIRMGYRREQ